jgi:hypothetical protein
MSLKQCRGSCRETKEVTFFNKNKRMKDRLEPICKDCRVAKRQKINLVHAAARATVTEKTCNNCGETKSVDHFTKDGGLADGFRADCNECRTKYRLGKAEEYSQFHQTQSTEEKEKQCTVCKAVLPMDDFGYKKHKLSGKDSVCKKCRVVEAMANDRLKKLLVQRFLQSRSCVDCGCKDWKLLENDHTEDDKAQNANGLSYRTISKLPTLEKIISELKKCEVVCIKCHRLRTHRRFHPSSNHDIKKRKQERRYMVNQLKLAVGECMICHQTVSATTTFLFDWDHLDSSTKIESISEMCNTLQSMDKICQEIQKCRLLCCSCHRLHTRQQGEWNDVTDATAEELQQLDELLK